MIKKDDIATLVSIVGRSGAIGALVGSDIVKMEDLKRLAKELAIERASNKPKKELARRIVRQIDQRIKKGLDELQALTRDELLIYLEKTNCDSDDLKDLIKSAGLPVQAGMSRNDLLKFASIQISSLGVFERLSNSHQPEVAKDISNVLLRRMVAQALRRQHQGRLAV